MFTSGRGGTVMSRVATYVADDVDRFINRVLAVVA
jgi:hypothetical protein